MRYPGAGTFYSEIGTTDAGGLFRRQRFEFGRRLREARQRAERIYELFLAADKR